MQKADFARKNKPGKKARTKLDETFAKNIEANFRNLTLQKKTFATKTDFAKSNRLLAKTLPEKFEADYGNLSEFYTKLFETKT